MSIQDEIPRSRINLRYRTTVKGGEEMLELPLRLLILADLSLGSSVDRESDLESRRFRSLDGKNLSSVMEDMRMSMRFNVENCIDKAADEGMDIDLPIKNRRSFTPEQIAQNVPKIRALLLLRKLLVEMQSNIDNRKELRRIIQEIYSDPKAVESLKQELAAYADYKIPNPQTLPAKPAALPAQ